MLSFQKQIFTQNFFSLFNDFFSELNVVGCDANEKEMCFRRQTHAQPPVPWNEGVAKRVDQIAAGKGFAVLSVDLDIDQCIRPFFIGVVCCGCQAGGIYTE